MKTIITRLGIVIRSTNEKESELLKRLYDSFEESNKCDEYGWQIDITENYVELKVCTN